MNFEERGNGAFGGHVSREGRSPGAPFPARPGADRTLPGRFPRYLAIIGSAKCGTTTLARAIGAHPLALLGREKEPRFFTDFGARPWKGPATGDFARSVIDSSAGLLDNFEGLSDGQWAVDASTDYIWCPTSPEMLARFAKGRDVRLICILRDPVERAVSEYNETLSNGWEPLSFEAAIKAEPHRIAAGWHPLFHHRRRSTVRADIHRYADLFGDHLMIIDYADLAEPSALLHRIGGFLGIGDFADGGLPWVNQTFLPRGKLAGRLLQSGALRMLSQLLLTDTLRDRVRRRLRHNTREVETVTPRERQMFRDVLASEIRACRDDPLIPTDHWTCLP